MADLKVEQCGNAAYAVWTDEGPAVYPTLEDLAEAVRTGVITVSEGDQDYYDRHDWLPAREGWLRDHGLTGSWCVCGQEADGPWECAADELASRDEALEWLRRNHADSPGYVAWYVDREDNDGVADSYFDRNQDGSLSEALGGRHVYFCD